MSTDNLNGGVLWDVRTFSLGTQPGLRALVDSVASDGQRIYVPRYVYDPASSTEQVAPGELVVLRRTATGIEVVTRVPVFHQPRSVAVDTETNLIYVVNRGVSSVSVIDRQTLTVLGDQIRFPAGLVRVAVSRSRRRAYVTHALQGRVHVIDGRVNADPQANPVVGSFDVGRGATGIAVDDALDRLYVTRHPDPGGPPGILVVVDLANERVLPPVLMPADASEADSIAVVPSANRIYVAHQQRPVEGRPVRVVAFDRTSLEIVAEIPTARVVSHITYDARSDRVFATMPEGVHVIDPGQDRIETTIPLPPSARGIAVDPATREVFAGDLSEGRLSVATPRDVPAHDLTVVRPDDLLHLDFDFINLTLVTGGGQAARLVRRVATDPAFIVVHFPPQAMGEQAFGSPPFPLLVRARLARAARLVFRVPSTMAEVPYTVESLLGWDRFELSLVATALPADFRPSEVTPPPVIVEPGPQQTAIEAPYRLVLSPDRTARWQHAPEAVTHAGFAELWHTRLTIPTGTGVGPARRPTLRVVWSPDLEEPNGPPHEFPASLDPAQRRELVRLTCDFGHLSGPGAFTPLPVEADLFMLSALGVWMRTRGSWNVPAPPGAPAIAQWHHVATQGRDQQVRVIERGFLGPFMHRAVRVTTTEREIVTIPTGISGGGAANVAVLRQRRFIIVREPERSYEALPYPHAGREMPFATSIRLVTTETPEIVTTDADRLGGPQGAFWVRTAEGDFPFHIVATDPDGRQVELSANLFFVPESVVLVQVQMEAIAADYGAAHNEERRAVVAGAQPVAFARREVSQPGDTILATQRIWFAAPVTPTPSDGGFSFMPALDKASVRIPSLEAFAGEGREVTVRHFGRFLDSGFSDAANKARIFAEIDPTQRIAFNLHPEQAGGLVSAAMEIGGVSQHLGPLAGKLQDLADGQFDPASFFSAALPGRLLGVISLAELITKVFAAGQFPKVLTETVTGGGVPQAVVTRLDWKPEVRGIGDVFLISENPKTTLEITAELTQPLEAGTPPASTVHGQLTSFAINFLDVVQINFEKLEFIANDGRKLDVNADLVPDRQVEFAGALSFLSELQRFIPRDGFSDPPSLDVTERGVDAGYSLALPPVAVGVFALQNVTLGANLHLPFFDESARLRFNFAERHSPFQLTVSLFSGGGFFALDVALDRIVILEAAIEFGGSVSFNLGVASGGVHVMAGVYFKLGEEPATGTELSGYLRAGGALQVLGLVCVSVEFYMALTYRPANNEVHGQAQLTVKVSIAFFSKSVTLKVERRFAGSSGGAEAAELAAGTEALAASSAGLTFADLMTAQDWAEYAAAFA